MSNRRKIWSAVWAAAVIACQTTVLAERIDTGVDAEKIRKIVLSRGADPAAPAQLVQLARGLEPTIAADLFRRLADDYLQAGQLRLAAEVLSQLLDQYPEQEAATTALLNIVRLYSSGEISHTTHLAKPASAGGDPTSLYALHVAEQAIQRRPELSDNPALAFQCAVAARRAGREKSALGWLTRLKHDPRLQPWHDCAHVENWLAGSRDESPRMPVVTCLRTSDRPHLDGLLDDATWGATTALVLQDRQTSVRLARDDEFLYLAIHCEKADDATYPTDARPRIYDTDLTEQDHVRLLLDVDRDYATWFALSVDYRSWTSDACWRDPAWNPKWFVAAGGDEAVWTVEAAIPWTELCPQPPLPGEAWALALERRVPTTPTQPWHGPPSEKTGPEKFGLLVFD